MMNFVCFENLETESLRAEKDLVLFHDDRVLPNLKTAEKRYVLDFDYFQTVQKDVEPFMRKIVTTWMLEVCEETKSSSEVFPAAVNILDRFLAKCNISRDHLQLAGSTCLLLASKIVDASPLRIEILCYYTDNSVTAEQMINWELLVLSKLNWNIAPITAHNYLDHILERMSLPRDDIKSKIRNNACQFVEQSYVDSTLFQTLPSTIAAASIYASFQVLNLDPVVYDMNVVYHLTQTNSLDVERLLSLMYDTFLESLAARARKAALSLKVQEEQMIVQNNNNLKEDEDASRVNTPTDIQEIQF